MSGIVGYGAYIPRTRITSEEIAPQWGKDPGTIARGLLLKEKSVPGLDEDTITISVAASRDAVERAGIDPARIGAAWSTRPRREARHTSSARNTCSSMSWRRTAAPPTRRTSGGGKASSTPGAAAASPASPRTSSTSPWPPVPS